MSLILSLLCEALHQHADDDLLEGILPRRSEVARSWWRRMVKARLSADDIRAALHALAAFGPHEAAEIGRELAETNGSVPPLRREAIGRYLSQVPDATRKQFRLAGENLLPMNEHGDLLPLLRPRVPSFYPGKSIRGLGDLELGAFRGASRTSEVYEAHNPHLPGAAPVVVKVSLHPDGRRLLDHEARMNDLVRSRGCKRGVLPVKHTFLSSEVPALLYPAVDGFDLQESLMALHGRNCFPHPRWVAELMHRLALVLKPLHANLLVHRDLKLTNIMMGQVEGGPREILVIDFGISGPAGNLPPEDWPIGMETRIFIEKLLIYGRSEITASPAQRQNKLSLPRDDVYSLGVVASQALTGNFTKRVDPRTLRNALRERDVPEEFIELLAACVAEQEHRRPADGDELASRLQDVIDRADW